MNKDKLYDLVNNPLLISQNDINDLKELVTDYPYFHSAHILLLKGLHSTKSIKFDQQLQHSAISVPDRRKLYKILFFADQLFENKLNFAEEIDAKENLLEIASDKELNKQEEEAIELLDFNFNNTRQKPSKKEREDLLEYEYYSDSSNTFVTSDYFSSYNMEDDEPHDDVYLNSFYTFDEWLKMMKNKKDIPEKKVERKNNKTGNNFVELIDNFIKEKPRIVPHKDELVTKNMESEESLEEKTDFITETLAVIYTKQGHYAKAILAYQKLSLKYPEKNSYFADQIKKLEKLIKEQ